MGTGICSAGGNRWSRWHLLRSLSPYISREEYFPLHKAYRNIIFGRLSSESLFSELSARMHNNECDLVEPADGSRRSSGTRIPSDPARFNRLSIYLAVTILAPEGNPTFRKGCAWFFTNSLISVSDLPSEVMRVVIQRVRPCGEHAAVRKTIPCQR